MSDAENTIAEQLAAPFDYDALQFRPTATRDNGSQGLMVAYLDASAVAQRLDDVVGIEGWSDTYKVIDDKTVECELTLYLGGVSETDAITKADVGVMAGGGFDETLKGAYSDALKRAARKWGIGRYLAVLGGTWMALDRDGRAKERPPLPGTGGDTAERPAEAPHRPGGQQPGPAEGWGDIPQFTDVGGFLNWALDFFGLTADDTLRALERATIDELKEMGLQEAGAVLVERGRDAQREPE